MNCGHNIPNPPAIGEPHCCFCVANEEGGEVRNHGPPSVRSDHVPPPEDWEINQPALPSTISTENWRATLSVFYHPTTQQLWGGLTIYDLSWTFPKLIYSEPFRPIWDFNQPLGPFGVPVTPPQP